MVECCLHVGGEEQKFSIPFHNVSFGKMRYKPENMPGVNCSVEECFNQLIGNVDLTNINDKSNIVIVCDDYTRPTPTYLILPDLMKFLQSLGAKKENISLLVGGGFHRIMTEEELIKKYSREIVDEYPIYQHDALKNEEMVYLSETSMDIPVYINKRAVEADFLIGIGVVEIHPWAGYSGGGKIICPGVSGKITINHTHSLPVLAENVCMGESERNPFWQTINEVGKMVGLDMVINVVLNGEEEILAIYAGEAKPTQKRCIEVFQMINEVMFEEPADIVITSSDPKFQYWGQASIAGYNMARIVKDDGTRVVLAKMPEGFGDQQQEVIFYFDTLRDSWDNLDQYWMEKMGVDMDNSRNACAAHRHLLHLKKSDMIMVTQGFPTSTPPMKSQKYVATIEEAMEIVYKKYGPDATVSVMDMGGMYLSALKDKGE